MRSLKAWLIVFGITLPITGWTPPTLAAQPIDDEMIEEAAREMSGRLERQAASTALTARALDAFGSRRFDDAEEILLEQVELDPDNFVPHYNLACARSVLGKLNGANASLRRAVELGFSNIGHLRLDPYLEPLRGSEPFEALIGSWPLVLEMQRRSRLERERRWIRGSVIEIDDPELLCDVLSAHDRTETDRALIEMRRVDGWAAKLFDTPIETGSQEGTGSSDASHEPYVVVALPGPQDFLKWAFWTYGGHARRAFSGIGGAYEHDEKRLVAQDLGATLRHEFFHVLHWRDMDRRRQVHPVWIQEGLASLVEDMDPPGLDTRTRSTDRTPPSNGPDPRLLGSVEEATTQPSHPIPPTSSDGTWEPVPSWRTNIVQRLAGAGKLKSLEELTSLDHTTFSTNRPLAAYAQARTVLLYLDDRGALESWYRVYTTDPDQGYDADPSGLAAMEAVLGEETSRIESRYRDWLRNELEEVPERGGQLKAGLGVDLEPGPSGGPKVSKLPSGARRRTGLRLGDVITSVDGRPVRDMKEYVRVMSAYTPGNRVTLTYRRFKLHGESEALLVEGP